MTDSIIFEGNEIRPGGYFAYSWGNEQTNVHFYQVVAVSGKSTVKIRRIEAFKIECHDAMTGTCYPRIDVFKDDEVITKRLVKGEPAPIIKFDYGRGRYFSNPYKAFRFSTYG